MLSDAFEIVVLRRELVVRSSLIGGAGLGGGGIGVCSPPGVWRGQRSEVKRMGSLGDTDRYPCVVHTRHCCLDLVAHVNCCPSKVEAEQVGSIYQSPNVARPVLCTVENVALNSHPVPGDDLPEFFLTMVLITKH